MPRQTTKSKPQPRPPAKAEQEAPEATRASSEPDEELEALLEQIDAVLETNAEEFIRGFVQKGGE